MTMRSDYTIELTCDYEERWRYNTVLMCGCFDEQEERTDFVATTSQIAPVGSQLDACPAGVDPQRTLSLVAPDCHYLMLYLYLIPHTSPSSQRIEQTPPFAVHLRICRAGTTLHDERYPVSQWGGGAFEIKVKGELCE